MRVIADHVRTLTFAIGDGALPSNEGRGYVLRRILRRAARFGRNLGMHEPFIYQLVPTLVETMSYIFPEIKTNQEHIQKIIKGEEESFNTTLDRGLEIFEEMESEAKIRHLERNGFRVIYETVYQDNSITKHRIIIPFNSFNKIADFPEKGWSPELNNLVSTPPIFSGADAFKLYDTFGFPLDLTELMESERGLKVDVDAFNKLMEEQKERSRETRAGSLNITGHRPQVIITGEYTPPEKTSFLGYSETKINSIVVANDARWFALRETPFYGESGGQVGDTGFIIADGIKYNVIDTKRDQDIFLHITIDDLPDIKNKIVTAEIDLERRLSIMRNHSATHLLHNALRRILGTHVHQAGSLVAPDYLRFDFAHFAKLKRTRTCQYRSIGE